MTSSDTPQTPRLSGGERWSDLDRPPLNESALRRALVRPGGLWTALDVLPRTGSTHSDLVARAAAGASEGQVLVAEEQTAGRGRLDRSWTAPPRSGLFFSVLLQPGPTVPVERWGWLPLLAGVATANAISHTAGVDTALKWPNDLLVTVHGEERKFGGILAERTPAPSPAGARAGAGGGTSADRDAGEAHTAGTDASGGAGGVVVGVGLNVSLRAAELPVAGAGSLTLAGASEVDRDPLLRAVLRSLEQWYGEWRDAEGDPAASRLQEAYATGCATLGRSVRALLPGERECVGEAVAIDGYGQLVIATEGGGREAVSAGDIVHLRPASPGE
ncbi:biotin--[acetyl-CoA-carboxylase] ligase [Streptomyces zagrosensis]|uniref:biotin--[biotin carboxyl-carrier protein] ligase n=1 Tax=Streptomyces zagrosensis TaxID=1042984 RepID=A0A7W9QFH8_9ACTN|nr:biotin--[acetyl-CoA-carboxylase] ligase [Streptomyces zagrosensis]MBB5939186.1 BirA family biotin operon repressor/biotin-[acetyl-CoA-carboxylase] ligase [Streptomyces zagrosensis]